VVLVYFKGQILGQNIDKLSYIIKINILVNFQLVTILIGNNALEVSALATLPKIAWSG